MNWVPDGFQPPGWQPEGWQPEGLGGGGEIVETTLPAAVAAVSALAPTGETAPIAAVPLVTANAYVHAPVGETRERYTNNRAPRPNSRTTDIGALVTMLEGTPGREVAYEFSGRRKFYEEA